MKHVDAKDLERASPGVIEALERGETLAIVRDGKTVGTLVPDPAARAGRAGDILARFAEIRSRVKPTTVDEILAWRHEGHEY